MGMVTALVPGSFDPVHLGHLDVIEAASGLFDRVVVAAVQNPGKDPLFVLADRQAMIEESVGHLGNVEVRSFSGLVVQLAAEVGAQVIVKGLRGVTDFDGEMQMAQMNAAVGDVRTLFLPTAPALAHLASRYIREIARGGGNVGDMVPPVVAKRLEERFTT